MEILAVLIGLFIVATAALVSWLRRGRIPGIPGCADIPKSSKPTGNYVLGHVFHLGGNFCRTFLEWKKDLGPVFQLRVFNVRVVVFNDKESIAKVCALPQASGRARYGFFLKSFEIAGEGVANGEGPIWEEQRQFYLKSFRTFGIGRSETERSLQDEIRMKLEEWEKIGGAPFELDGCNAAFVFNALWSVLGGQRLETSKASELVNQVNVLTKMDTIGHKIAFIAMGIAEKFTNAVQEKVQAIRTLTAVAAEMVAEHQESRTANEPRDVIDQILDRMDVTEDENSFAHKNKLNTGFALYELIAATIDTTSRTLEWLMLHLARNPNLVSKLQAEINHVFGDDLENYPTLADREKMPYAQACILEALRIGSVVPFGVPHKALEDFEYDGALIPKGTLLIMNQYGVHFDPEVWDQPEEFKPERFLTPEGDKIGGSVKNKIVPFGIGRRICLGNTIAMDTMFLYIVNAYRKFEFEVVGGGNGKCEERFGIIRYAPAGVKIKAVYRH